MENGELSNQNRKREGRKSAWPNSTECHGEFIMQPDYVKCLVTQPIHCVYVCALNGNYFCAHEDRLNFVSRGEGAKS